MPTPLKPKEAPRWKFDLGSAGAFDSSLTFERSAVGLEVLERNLISFPQASHCR